MKVRWTPEAEQDRYNVVEYIAADNPRAAVKMDELFGDSVAMLANFPLMGRNGVVSGTRELILHENYRLVYDVEDECVWILALVHIARQWPQVR